MNEANKIEKLLNETFSSKSDFWFMKILGEPQKTDVQTVLVTNNIDKSLYVAKIAKGGYSDKTNYRPEDHAREILCKDDYSKFVSILKHCVAKEHSIYYFKYLLNGNLHDRLFPNLRMKEDDVRNIFNSIIHGVEHLHKLDIVLRELTLKHLLIDDQKNIKISSFDKAVVTDSDGLVGYFTPATNYKAPEFIEDPTKRYFGTKLDVWCIGVCIYRMVVGYFPFKEIPHNIRIFLQHEISNDFFDIVYSILDKEPEKRIPLNDLFNHDWYFDFPRILRLEFIDDKKNPFVNGKNIATGIKQSEDTNVESTKAEKGKKCKKKKKKNWDIPRRILKALRWI